MTVTRLPRVQMSENREHNEAVAYVQKLNEDLVAAQQEITDLQMQLRSAQDYAVRLEDERNDWKAEAILFRTKLVELATQMDGIGKLTESAKEVTRHIYELTSGPIAPTAEQKDSQVG